MGHMLENARKCSNLVSFPRPETLNLEQLRGKGLQPGEELLPEEPDVPAAQPEVDEMIVAQLLSMGIGENAAREPFQDPFWAVLGGARLVF